MSDKPELTVLIPEGQLSQVHPETRKVYKPGKAFDGNELPEDMLANRIKSGAIVTISSYANRFSAGSEVTPEQSKTLQNASKTAAKKSDAYGEDEARKLKDYCTYAPEDLKNEDRDVLDTFVEEIFEKAGVDIKVKFKNKDQIKEFLTGENINEVLNA